METAVVVVAAGRGRRAAGGPTGVPKQYRALAGKSVLARALAALAGHPAVEAIVTVIHPDDGHRYAVVAEQSPAKLLPPAIGGATRQASVRAGLEALSPARPRHVLIHDAARPFVTGEVVDRVIAALAAHDGAVPGLPVTDTLKRTTEGRITATLEREELWHAQTPQGFRYEAIRSAHARAVSAGRQDFTDDAALGEWAGLDVVVVPGSPQNRKLTHEEDFAMAEKALEAGDRMTGGEWRTGHGFDAHGFALGDHLMLCGVRIPHASSLHGHSDADVGLHALTDALLGAIADGDIGAHFPPSDAKWRNAASEVFLADAAARVRQRGGRIANVDVTLICEQPRIAPHRQAMRARLAEILAIALERVSVKATTTEGLGFTGRREGIAAHASATVWLP